MKMETDAQGLLLSIVPLVMRMNINIVNIDSSVAARKKEGQKFQIIENKAFLRDISLFVDDNLNLHKIKNNEISYTIYVLRKDGHYDILYTEDYSNKINIDALAYSH